MIEKLISEIHKKQAPIVVGLDPNMAFIPSFIKKAAIEECGETLEAAAGAVLAFNKAIVDAVYDLVPAVKPQIAMYEQFGIPGLIAYKETIDYCRSRGLFVIADVKRADIGSTSKSYANAHLGKITVGKKSVPVFDADFATVNPYLGTDGVKPFLDVCKDEDKGIFVLVKTSNPSSGEFQDKKIGWNTLYELVGDKVEEWGKDLRHGQYSDVGAVVGATYPEMGAELRERMPHTFILVPGYGAQGGKGADLKGFFDKNGDGAIVNSSRGIIAAYTKPGYEKYGEENFADASRAAVLDMKQDLKNAIA
ncbi:MAG: orotidine-5'-phosphate decarboxylase [Lachnospiraceae bacterium]|uniref:Orotidine 5'-phosphate decarboxylase n=1 Tax=Candidatus Weimeria bifida TaxID=2599074 RepID=A0A6N7J193_9FIRM|nr:orotidine-5'-phosphate decarboxylase [Candidatus Weimeria bifida]RRF96492.1 MAG: orotidine-5'-phosphate decarboxylase [Lachnospiraceae bacterium]